MTPSYAQIPSPVGPLLLAWLPSGLIRLSFRADSTAAWRPPPDWRSSTRDPFGAETQLQTYFDGQLQRFDLPLQPAGTPFQGAVWQALARVPYGRTITYGELAALLGKPRAARAVGAALGRNPLPIIVPCHRVVGSDGSLTGFAGGVDIKRSLLALETRSV